MSFTWVNGRQLSALQKGDLNVSYSYNSDGLRVSKTVNGVKTEYVWDGSNLIGQKTGNNVLVYLYAADGLAGFQYNGVNYYYLKNGQGDVVAILDASGNIVAKYAYDAWGKLLSVTDAAGNDKSADASFIGNINPIRYRSYYYDTETGLYYLQSRYYDPEVGRFVNADDIMGVNEDIYAYNLFAYCGNNPVCRADSGGQSWWSVVAAAVVVVAVCAVTIMAAPVAAPVIGAAAATSVATTAFSVGTAATTIGIAATVVATAEPYLDTKSESDDDKKTRSIPKTKKPNFSGGTKIYRSASGTFQSLTPRPGKDYDGLSFSLTPPKGKYFETTVEKVNATLSLVAFIDGPNHCSVRPKHGTIEGWMMSRTQSTPHLYTLVLRAILDGPYWG